MDKVGIRGTATARLAFHDMFVPKENILGQLGKGLRLALTVLDFGRTTFGASCTGVGQVLRAGGGPDTPTSAGSSARPLGEFELVREKIALAAAECYAMESATYHTAALIDTGAEDYMLETSMIKLFASDSLWRIVNDTLQIHGGAGFFTDRPFERMMRDARINLIGEGANDVLRCFNCTGRPAQRRQGSAGYPQKAVAGRDAVAIAAARFPCDTACCSRRPARSPSRSPASPVRARARSFKLSRKHHRPRVCPGPARRHWRRSCST